MRPLAMLFLAVAITACGGDDDGGGPDAATPPVGPCSPEVSYFGELLDIAVIGGGFQGVAGAVFTVDGTDETATSAPNGRVELCVAVGTRPTVTVDAPDDYLDGTYSADAALFVDGSAFVAHATTTAQLAALYTGIAAELAPDPTRGHLLVEVRGGTATVGLTGVAGPAGYHLAGGTWTPTGPGSFALFPNLAPGTVTVSAPGTAGGGSVPITAGGWSMTTLDVQ
jgi:hypothetical protein